MVDVVGSGGANIEVQADVSSSDGDLTTVPVPNIFQSIPSICEGILENNLRRQSPLSASLILNDMHASYLTHV
jgi:hypothetical protein